MPTSESSTSSNLIKLVHPCGQKSLDLCTVTATLGDDTTAHTVRTEAKKDETPTDDKKMMGEVHTLTWGATQGSTDVCAKTIALKDDGSGGFTHLANLATASASGGEKILVLPIENPADNCVIGDTTIEFDANAYDSTTAFGALGCAAGTCWKWDNNTATDWATGTNEPATGEDWIKKGANDKYIFHNLP